VTLLGDACHPMYPFMAQGAAQAIEDGATLVAVLASDGDPAETLRRYEQLRLPRVTRLQEMSRANKHRYHMPDGPEQQTRDAAMAAARERAPETMQWLFGFDAGAVEPAEATS
jgi:salicylate hydroxylase